MRPHIRFQVFISSTFTDLKDERRAVASELLGAGYIPAGMEDFPATDDRGWKIIRRSIDLCDYYVLVIAGRYGTVDPTINMSWTEREYDYAVSKKIKVLAFIRDDAEITKDKEESTEDGRERYAVFVAKVKAAHHYKSWKEKDDLVVRVTAALAHARTEDEEDGSLPPGWVRGDELPTVATADELARLSKENAELRTKVAAVSTARPQLELRVGERDSSTPIAVMKPPINIAAVANSHFGRMDTAQDWADTIFRTLWIPLTLHNLAPHSPSHLVKVVVTFDDVEALDVGRSRWRQRDSDGEEYSTLRVAYVESVDVSRKQVVQRVSRVSADGEEELIRVGARVPRATMSAGAYIVGMGYYVRDESGASARGRLQFLVSQAAGTTTVDDPEEVCRAETYVLG